MSRTKWAVLLALFALAALAVPFLGYSRPFCTGGVDLEVSKVCMAEWEALMPAFPQRFVYLLGVPMSAVVIFLVLTGIALVVDMARRSRRKPSRDIARR
jgi:hypothetical protein